MQKHILVLFDLNFHESKKHERILIYEIQTYFVSCNPDALIW